MEPDFVYVDPYDVEFTAPAPGSHGRIRSASPSGWQVPGPVVLSNQATRIIELYRDYGFSAVPPGAKDDQLQRRSNAALEVLAFRNLSQPMWAGFLPACLQEYGHLVENYVLISVSRCIIM